MAENNSTQRQANGQPTLSFCLSIRNSDPKLLEQCLQSVRDRAPAAEIVIVDNVSREKECLEVAKKYADIFSVYRGPQDNWTEDMPFTEDMAASRQHGFNLATGRWIAWIDDDDRLPGPEEVEKLLKLNSRWQPKPDGARIESGTGKPQTLEDLLLKLEETIPEANCIWAPYLYSKDQDGKAYVWQERERIIKKSDPPMYHWQEAAHEILVPLNHTPKHKISFSHLLFVHEKDFSAKAHRFAIERHFAVLHKQYQEGDRTTRRCIYLAAYAATLCPEREKEFIEAAHVASATALDRCRSMMSLGNLYAKQGLMNDALEAFASATALRGDLPDPWILGGEVWARAERWDLAAEWLEKGISAAAGRTESQINPRFQAIRYPTLLSDVYHKLADHAITIGLQDMAVQYLTRATELLDKARLCDAAGNDARELNTRFMRMRNALLAQQNAIEIGRLVQYLVDNDEPRKALQVLHHVPWNLEDHPVIVEWERRLSLVKTHLEDEKAYLEFYTQDERTGYVESPEKWLTPEGCLGRAKWIAEWINANCPNAFVLDNGCFDGIIGIPLLHLCPGIKYLGVDVYQKPVERFRERIASRGFTDRAQVQRLDSLDQLGVKADVAIWSEVIEHVQDPSREMTRILRQVRDNGVLLLTTPWGSFDAGHPPEKTDHGTPRDSRGHVRVLTARRFVDVMDRVGICVEELYKEPSPIETPGDELRARVINRSASHQSITFAVPGALWDWNGRTLEGIGMGASEKSIVQFGSALTSDRQVDVYGPVPEANVHRSVRYWPREQLRHVRDGKIVVSRNPSYWKHLRETVGLNNPLLLWLQDAHYPDLNTQVSENYETIIVVSEWHKMAMNRRHGVPQEKMKVIYNPVDAALYEGRVGTVERKRDRFVYCSSPDRGLIPLLKLWPRILRKLPYAELIVAYGFRGCEKLGLGNDAAWTQRYEKCRREFEALRYQQGIYVVDMIPPWKMAETFLSSGVWSYPTDHFEETCCANALEARAAGCVPVCPPIAALEETAQCLEGRFLTPIPDTYLKAAGALKLKMPGETDWQEAFVEACVEATRVSDSDRQSMSKEAIEKYRVEQFLPIWNAILS